MTKSVTMLDTFLFSANFFWFTSHISFFLVSTLASRSLILCACHIRSVQVSMIPKSQSYHWSNVNWSAHCDQMSGQIKMPLVVEIKYKSEGWPLSHCQVVVGSHENSELCTLSIFARQTELKPAARRRDDFGVILYSSPQCARPSRLWGHWKMNIVRVINELYQNREKNQAGY